MRTLRVLCDLYSLKSLVNVATCFKKPPKLARAYSSFFIHIESSNICVVENDMTIYYKKTSHINFCQSRYS